MSVFKRSTSKGETEEYHYRFMFQGHDFSGVCEGCTTKTKAEAYERTQKETLKKGSEQKTARAFAENMRNILTGGNNIQLAEAYDKALEKPRKKEMGDKQNREKRSRFQDFVDFMADKFPDIQFVNQIEPKHAEAYIAYIREHGRFNKDVVYTRGTKTLKRQTTERISATTSNVSLMCCKEVFALLMRDAGLLDNPFAVIPKLAKDETEREAFTEDEIKAICNSKDTFCRDMFCIGFATALREGDVCTLKWQAIDFSKHIISVIMRKTKHAVSIPISDSFESFLLELKQKAKNSEYVLPEQAGMYLNNPSGISYRVKSFLESLGIETTKTKTENSRQISVKDFHSCRHTFCYYAGVNNVPLPIVQSIVGHMTPAMTAHYMAHVRTADKIAILKKLPSFLIETAEGKDKADSHIVTETIRNLSKTQYMKISSYLNSVLTDEQRQELIRIAKGC